LITFQETRGKKDPIAKWRSSQGSIYGLFIDKIEKLDILRTSLEYQHNSWLSYQQDMQN